MAESVSRSTEWLPDAICIRKTLIDLCKKSNVEELQFLKNVEICVTDIGDGNLNNVMRVFPKNDPSKSVIIKHAPPYIKLLGPNFPLSPERGELEFKAARKFYSISPGSVPKPLAYHATDRVFCMEDLKDYTVYRKWMLAGNVDLDVAKKLAKDIALVHCQTHVANIGQEAIAQLDKEFYNPDILGVTDTYVFTTPFRRDAATNHWSPVLNPWLDSVHEDQEILQAASNLHRIFQTKKEALIHGDLHTGSALVKDKDIKMFDLEFAMVGPCAFDLGLLIANYIFCYHYHMLNPENNDAGRHLIYKLVDVCNATVDEYLTYMTCSIGDRKEYVKQLMSESAGFAGCELIRRLLGAGRVEDMDSLETAQPDTLMAGCRLLKAYHRIHEISFMMNVALMLTF